MNVNIDSTVMGQMIGAAVMNSITQEQRDLLIKQAIEHLLTVDRNSYTKKSPLQDAFNRACDQFATQYVREQLETDATFSEALRAMMDEAYRKAFTERREEIVTRMAESISNGFKVDSRY